jgi:transposase
MAQQRDHGAMEKRRLKAAELFAQGKGPSEVARLLKVRRQSAHAWQRQWQQGGAPALHSKGAAGPKTRLSTAQQADVATAIIAGPQAHGYATAVWTLPRVAKLIEQRTGQGYHPGHVWRVLRGLGFSCQQPTRRAIERDEVAIAQWKRVGWRRLKKRPGAKAAPSSSSTKVA